ncbi:unnamed protein product [Anisakis simplex]|uniref:Upf2 domain-containing protein n=1 Tax=Anisakis simplex TaxID=6269 RepID=A0A0M3K5Q8_ANISI|nr:unnamed protein product [Anisakis simplex]
MKGKGLLNGLLFCALRYRTFMGILITDPQSNPIKSNPASAADTSEMTRMAILTKTKGNKAVLKAIPMEAPSGLTDAWSAERERERRELSEHKHITLTMNERMMADEGDSD